TAAVVDLEHQRLPNALLVLLAVLALAWRWFGDQDFAMGLLVALITLAAGVLIDAAHKALKGRSGLGFGDTKLMAVAALALPLGQYLLFLSMSGFLGLALGLAWRARTGVPSFPFGPAILLALWISLAAGDAAIELLVSI
ncbi:MAG: prepilin peptidase, partial [Rhodospirillaceae bacterium]